MSATNVSSNDTMKAWQYDQSGVPIEDSLFLNNTAARPRVALGPEEVLVHVVSMSLNPIDYKIAETNLPLKYMVSKPATPGLDFVGRVVSTGAVVDSLADGQLVFGRLPKPTQFGTLGEFVVAELNGCVAVPSGVKPDEAASIGTAGMTAYQCIQPYVKAGDRVFINGGSGGTGCYGIQIAKALGAGSVTTTCSSANTELCKSLGADEVIDYTKFDVASVLKAKEPYDLVVDNVGTPSDLYLASTHFLKRTGQFVQVGAAMNMGQMGSIASRMLKPAFLGGGTSKYKFLGTSNDPAGYRQLGEWLREGKIKAVIDSTYEFKDALQAFKRLKSGRTQGKLIVHVSIDQL